MSKSWVARDDDASGAWHYMTEIERLVDELHWVFAGGAWHGPALAEALAGVTAGQAAARPIARAHSIWEIVLHLLSASRVVCRRLEGEPADATGAEDWPPVVETNEAAWSKLKEALAESQRELLAGVSSLSDAALDRPIVEGFATVYRTLHGHAQHVAYHAGQIMALRKALE